MLYHITLHLPNVVEVAIANGTVLGPFRELHASRAEASEFTRVHCDPRRVVESDDSWHRRHTRRVAPGPPEAVQYL